MVANEEHAESVDHTTESVAGANEYASAAPQYPSQKQEFHAFNQQTRTIDSLEQTRIDETLEVALPTVAVTRNETVTVVEPLQLNGNELPVLIQEATETVGDTSFEHHAQPPQEEHYDFNPNTSEFSDITTEYEIHGEVAQRESYTSPLEELFQSVHTEDEFITDFTWQQTPETADQAIAQDMLEILQAEPVEQQHVFTMAIEAIADQTTPERELQPVHLLVEALHEAQTPNTHEDALPQQAIVSIIGVVHGHMAIREQANSEQLEAIEERLSVLVDELCDYLHVTLHETQKQDLIDFLLSPAFAEALLTANQELAKPLLRNAELFEQGTHEHKLKFGNFARHTTQGIQLGLHQLLGNLAVTHTKRNSLA